MNWLLKELGCKDREISLLLVDDEQIRDINRVYLNRDCPTNVISFSMRQGAFGNIHPEMLGDIVLSVETAARDALIGCLDLMDELDFLLIHGLLHILGYDHKNNDEREAMKMKNLERELFYRLRNYYLD